MRDRLVVIAPDVRRNRTNVGNVLDLRPREFALAAARGPQKESLYQVQVVQPLTNRAIVERSWLSRQRLPQDAVGPRLMPVEFLEQVGHSGIIVTLSACLLRSGVRQV